MNNNPHPGKSARQEVLQDPLWNLLAADAVARPVTPSPWFVSQTMARARTLGQSSTWALLFRWMMPLPLAALAAMAFVVLQGGGLHGLGKGGDYISSDSDFEEHMDLTSTEVE